MLLDWRTEIGVGLTALGSLLLTLGILLLFDRGLLATGNVRSLLNHNFTSSYNYKVLKK